MICFLNRLEIGTASCWRTKRWCSILFMTNCDLKNEKCWMNKIIDPENFIETFSLFDSSGESGVSCWWLRNFSNLNRHGLFTCPWLVVGVVNPFWNEIEEKICFVFCLDSFENEKNLRRTERSFRWCRIFFECFASFWYRRFVFWQRTFNTREFFDVTQRSTWMIFIVESRRSWI